MTIANLNRKVALVTGANRGIGRAVAEALLQAGFVTLVTARDEAAGEATATALRAHGEAHYLHLDVSDPASVIRAATTVERDFGRLDVLVNNAAIHYDTWHGTLDADLDDVLETFQTNLFGPWRVAQAFVPLMRRYRYGRVVNVSSEAGALSDMREGTPGYGISKAALNALTIKMADALRDTGVLVNAACPGWVRTGMGGDSAPRTPAEGADTIVWLAQLPDGGPSGKFFRDRREISF